VEDGAAKGAACGAHPVRKTVAGTIVEIAAACSVAITGAKHLWKAQVAYQKMSRLTFRTVDTLITYVAETSSRPTVTVTVFFGCAVIVSV
jgi:hypothetical protein